MENQKSYHILAACSDLVRLTSLEHNLLREGYQVTAVETTEGLVREARRGEADLLLLHYIMGQDGGLEVLQSFPQLDVDLPVICITPQGDVNYAIKSLQLGAVYFLIDWGNYVERLPAISEKAVYFHELKKSNQQAQETIYSQALLLNNVHDAVVAWNEKNEITYINFAARALFGMKSKDCLGMPAEERYFSLFEPEIILPTKKGTQEFSQERSMTRSDGSKIWVDSRISYIYDAQDRSKIISYMDISRDVTDRKRLSLEMEDARQKMIQSQRLAEVGELASGVAHQINNPLTAIIGEAQLARAGLDPQDPAAQALEAIEEAGWKVQQTVSQLMEYSREPESSYQRVDINNCIQGALREIQKTHPTLIENTQLSLSQDIPPVQGNPYQLDNLWKRLITGRRTRKGVNDADRVQIISRRGKDNGAQVEIIDNSSILSDEELSTFFDPDYYQDQDAMGIGYSYSICREIVRQHQGEIEIVNQGTSGTKIVTYFPGG